MKKKTYNLTNVTIFSLLLSFLIIPSITLAANKKVARVIILRGQVKAKTDSKIISLKKGMWLSEGSVIQTAPRSFCKLLFIDKSQMSLGPKSKMQIETFPKEKAGIINLLNGQLRAKISKNYMNMGSNNKSKLFIKTKSAAMGVRGTDFQVNFNRENMVTSLVTFEGAVAMARLDEQVNQVSQKALERMVSSKDAVIVVKGQYSGVDQASPKATPPTKINPTQLETLKGTTNNAKFLNKSAHHTPAEPAKKQFRSPVPPGVNAKAFANSSKGLEKSVVAVTGVKLVTQVKQQVAKEDYQDPKWAANKMPETTEDAPKAGGYLDLKTALYIPPPEDSMFDSNTGVFVPPPTIGTMDPITGGYEAPAGWILAPTGEFVVDPAIVVIDRAPASLPDGTLPPPTTTLLPPPPIVMPGGDIVLVNPDLVIGEELTFIEKDILQTVEDEFNEDQAADLLNTVSPGTTATTINVQ